MAHSLSSTTKVHYMHREDQSTDPAVCQGLERPHCKCGRTWALQVRRRWCAENVDVWGFLPAHARIGGVRVRLCSVLSATSTVQLDRVSWACDDRNHKGIGDYQCLVAFRPRPGRWLHVWQGLRVLLAQPRPQKRKFRAPVAHNQQFIVASIPRSSQRAQRTYQDLSVLCVLRGETGFFRVWVCSSSTVAVRRRFTSAGWSRAAGPR